MAAEEGSAEAGAEAEAEETKTGEADLEEIAETGAAVEEAVAEDTLRRHISANRDTISKDIGIQIYNRCSKAKVDMDTAKTKDIIKGSNNNIHLSNSSSNSNNSLKLFRCRETSSRAGSSQTCPGMEKGFYLDIDDDVLQHDGCARGEATDLGVDGQRDQDHRLVGLRGGLHRLLGRVLPHLEG